MLSLFDREKRRENNIRQKVTTSSNLVTTRSSELHEKIPEETDHPVLNKVKEEGSDLAEAGGLLRKRLNNLSTLEKPDKKQALKVLKGDANHYVQDVKMWDTKVITSLESHKMGYLSMAISPAQSGAMTRNNSASTSSSTANEPYVHPANYWDWALVDKINEAGKTPPVTLIKHRTGESEPDVY